MFHLPSLNSQQDYVQLTITTVTMEPYTPDADHRARLLVALEAVTRAGNQTLATSIRAALAGRPRSAGECFDVIQHPENPQI